MLTLWESDKARSKEAREMLAREYADAFGRESAKAMHDAVSQLRFTAKSWPKLAEIHEAVNAQRIELHGHKSLPKRKSYDEPESEAYRRWFERDQALTREAVSKLPPLTPEQESSARDRVRRTLDRNKQPLTQGDVEEILEG